MSTIVNTTQQMMYDMDFEIISMRRRKFLNKRIMSNKRAMECALLEEEFLENSKIRNLRLGLFAES